jgi:pimeloyl-ACP methyl ester carboxylesterase
MRCLTLAGNTNKRLRYMVEGEGFPLILVPALTGRIADWAPQLPLFGELCRVIAYEYGERPALDQASPGCQVQDLQALLDGLAIAGAYLAGYADGGLTALRMAWHCPQRVEGLLLIGMDTVWCEDCLERVTVPTCVFADAEAPRQVALASRLAAALPRGEIHTVEQTAMLPHREQPLLLGHAMIDFLMRCERQRNLVRGASFLL